MTQPNEDNDLIVVPVRPQINCFSGKCKEFLSRHERYGALHEAYEPKGDDALDEVYLGAFEGAREAEIAAMIKAPADDLSDVLAKARILLNRLVEDGANRTTYTYEAHDFGLLASVVQDLERLATAEKITPRAAA